MDKIKIYLPNEVLKIFEIIKEYGAESYIVGGSVRDAILGRPVHDYDICTPVPAIEIKNLFESKGYTVIPTGLKHGTVTVMMNGQGFEVTTYRKDGDYSDGRHPDSVEFVSDLEEDLARRDFTINAMAYNPEKGLVDPFHGIWDITLKKIRCVGNPHDRFNEDALRILRAIRFAAILGFEIEDNTHDAIMDLKENLNKISIERITNEFCKIISSTKYGLKKLLYTYRHVVAVFIPEVKKCFGCTQNNPHHYVDIDVYKHTLFSLYCYNCNPIEKIHREPNLIISLAIFFHDIAKPICKTSDENGIDHFYKHSKVGADIANEIMRRMKFDNETRERVVELIHFHDATLVPEVKNVRRWLNILGEQQFRRLLDLRHADILGQNQSYYHDRYEELKKVREILENVLSENLCFTLKDLAIDGNDLIKIGYKPGKELGETLNSLLYDVINDVYKNDKDELLYIASEMLRLNQ